MIISVSRRTDIPAFHGEWFMNGVKNGGVTVQNPFRPDLKRVVSLKKEDVDAFVFWTRYPQPFFRCLDIIDKNHIPYYFMFTINNYPDFLEPNLVELEKQLQSLEMLAGRIGRSRIVWRYDPIIVSKEMDIAYHMDNFRALSGRIAPFAGRVVISFLDLYRKTQRNLSKIAYQPEEIRASPEKLQELVRFLSENARQSGLAIQTCAEEDPLSDTVIIRGKCIDDEVLNSLFGLNINYVKDPGQRRACRCQRSIDIGSYGSCGFKCIYCYAL